MITIYQRQIAIHEAGHFVFLQMMNLGEVTLLSINPKQTKIGLSWGRMEYNPTPMDMALLAESSGKLDSCLSPKGIEKFRRDKFFFVNQLVVMHLAGPAAATTLAGYKGSALPMSDYLQSRDAALTIMPLSHVQAFLDRQLKETCELCRDDDMRDPILAVAERLLSKRTMDRDECLALWQEVDPRMQTAQNIPSAAPSRPMTPEPTQPRNASCACGSGRKYKKCCGGVSKILPSV